MTTTTKRFALLAMVAALAACDATGPDTSPEGLLDEDVAMFAADATLGDIASMVLPAGSGALAPGLGGPGSDGDGRRHGPAGTVMRSVEFFDADGNTMESFDELLTDRIHMTMELSAERQRENWSATIERSRDMTVSGLAGEETERTWDGLLAGASSRSRYDDENGERTHSVSESGTIADVVIAVDREANPWPLAGTVTRSITVTRADADGSVSETRDVVIVFDGTQYPSMTVNGEEFELDLAAREGRRPFRRRRGR